MYIVENENTLGYTIGNVGKIARMAVMAVDVANGGDPLLIDKTIVATNFREANEKDQERFGVVLSS